MQPDLSSFVSKLLELLGVEGAVELKTGHRTVVAVTSPESARLIGPGGEHLRALNMLARRLVEAQMEREPARPNDPGRSGGESAGFLIDVNGYHETAMEKVRQSARMLAQRARLFKHDVDLEPMSSYERLVGHELFAEDPEIKTEAAGEGKFRHIVLKYK